MPIRPLHKATDLLRRVNALFPVRFPILMLSSAFAFLSSVAEGMGFVCFTYLLNTLASKNHYYPGGGFIRAWMSKVLEMVPHTSPLIELSVLAGFMTACIAIKTFFGYQSRVILAAEQNTQLAQLRRRLFSRLLSISELEFETFKPGHLQGVLTEGTNSLAGKLALGRMIFHRVTSLVAYCLFMIYLDLTYFLMTMPILFLLLISCRKLLQDLKSRAIRSYSSTFRLNSYIGETLGMFPIIRQFSTQKQERSEFQKVSTELADAYIENTRANAQVNVALELRGVITIAMAIGCFRLLSMWNHRTFTPGMIIFLFTLHRFTNLISDLIQSVRGMAGIEPIVKDIELIFNAPAENSTQKSRLLAPFPQSFGSFVLQDVSFAYSGQSPVLKQVNWELKGGQRVVLKGPSGVGKSTLASVMARLLPASGGNILLDGQPSTKFEIQSWRRSVVVVRHDFRSRNLPLYEAISYGEDNISPEQAMEALEMVDLAPWLRKTGKDLKTLIGVNGTLLSWGQRQRLALARALLKRPSVIILDEALSNVDDSSGTKVLKNIIDFLPQSLIVIITHHSVANDITAAFFKLEGGTVQPLIEPGRKRAA